MTNTNANINANVNINLANVASNVNLSANSCPTVEDIYRKTLEMFFEHGIGDRLTANYRDKAVSRKKKLIELFGLDAAYPLRLYIEGDPIEFFPRKKILEYIKEYIPKIEHLFSSEEEMLESLITRRMPDGRRIVPVIREAAGLDEYKVNHLVQRLDMFHYDPNKHLFVLSLEPLDFILMSDVASFVTCHSLGGTYFYGNFSWAEHPTAFLWMKVDKTKDLNVPYKITRTINILGRSPIQGLWGIRQQRNYPHMDLSNYFPRVLIKRILGTERLIVKYGADFVRVNRKNKKDAYFGSPTVLGAYIDPPQVVGVYLESAEMVDTIDTHVWIRYEI